MSLPNETGTDLASAYLDDELEATDAKAFEELLESSPEVQKELEDLRKVISMVGGLGRVAAPDDFYDKLKRRLKRKQLLEPRTASRLALFAIPFQVVSILVILTVAALYMMAELDGAPATIERELPPLQGSYESDTRSAVQPPLQAPPIDRVGPVPEEHEPLDSNDR